MAGGWPLNERKPRLAFHLLLEQRSTVSITFVCSLFAASLEGMGIGLLVPLLQSITDPSTAPFHTGIGWVDHWVLGVDAPPLQRLYQVSGAIMASIVLRSGFAFVAKVASVKTTEEVLHSLRLRLFEQLSEVSLSFYTSRRSGALMNTMTTELERIRYMFQTMAQVVIRGLVLIAYAVLALWMSWKLTVVALVLLAVLSLGLKSIITRTKRRGRAIARDNSRVASIAGELIAGIKTVKAFGAEPFERERYRQASESLVDSSYRTGRSSAAVKPIAEALASAVLVMLVVVSVRLLVVEGSLSVPTLLTFLFALFRLLPIVHELNNARGTLANLHGSWTQILEVLSRSDKPYLTDGAGTPGPFRDSIQFDHVDFEYEPGRPVLRDVHLTIGCGETVALVGASGAGKSTLVDLIPRFSDPTRGRVLLDGVDLRDLTLESVRSLIAVVSQDTFLFNGTVAENIAYGLEGVSPDRISEVALQANALDFIEDLPEGMETVLGDRGVRLSGGQRQRIAIARALLRDPEILILDEATSALDSVTEQLVQDSLERLMDGRTVIIIAHRLSTVEHADQVVVLEGGVIVEKDTYSNLVNSEGKFWDFHRVQYSLQD